MGGLTGGAGGGSSQNPFASAGGSNAYGTMGSGSSAPWGIGDTTPATDVGTYNDPTFQANQQAAVASPPPPPATTAPGGQQSGSDNSSWTQTVSNILLGKDSNQLGSAQAQATSTGAQGGPPTPTQGTGPGWITQAPAQAPAPGTIGNPAGDFVPSGNANPAPAATPAAPPASAAAGTPPPGQPFPGTDPYSSTGIPQQISNPLAEQATVLNPPASVSPQSSQNSGKTNQNAAPAAPATAPAPDPNQYSSQGYTEHGAGYGDTSTTAGAGTGVGTPSPGGQGTQGIGGKGNALGDLLTLNFGRFFSDLFGGQGAGMGQPGAQPGATSSAPSTNDPATAEPGAGPAASPLPTGVAATPTGISGPGTPPTRLAATSTGLPDQVTQPGAAQAAPAAPTDPTTGRPIPGATAQYDPATGWPLPGTTTAAAPASGTGPAQAATPPGAPTGGTTVGTPGSMATSPAGAGFASRPADEGGAHPVRETPAAPAPMGSGKNWWGTQPPDYFQRHGGRPGADITSVNTPYGRVSVNKQVAPDLQALTQDMQAAGIPGISKLGGFNDRGKRYGSGKSSHAYGGAVDMNDAVAQDPRTKAWIDQHPQQWQDMLRRHNFAQYMPQRDPNHLEWTGPNGGGRGTAVATAARGPAWANALQNPQGPLTRGDRNMNPGNIKWGPDARAAGATGQDSQGHAVFPNVQAGIQAQASLLRRNYNNKTVPEMGRSYAEDRGWAKGVMAAGGFRPNERLNLNDPATMDRLQRAIWRQEGTHPQVAQTAAASRDQQLWQPTGTSPQASSTTYQDELIKRGQANTARQLGWLGTGSGPVGLARTTLAPTSIGRDWQNRPSLGAQAGVNDIERLLYGWGGPS